MLTPNVFQFFRGGRVLRGYKATLRDMIRQEPAIRLLPSLLDLPLIPDNLGTIIPLFHQSPRVAISGAIGSGRSLLLRQVAAQWADAERADRALYLSLARSDAPNLSPRAVLTAAVHGTGLGTPLAEGRPSTDTRTWLLLLDDWEDLPPQRQQVWRTFIERLPQTWPAARAVIALPAGQAWPGMPAVTLGEPDDKVLQHWVRHLLPGYDHAAIFAALGPDQPLAGLRASVRDIALLAVTFPVYGMPASRRLLYEHAAALAGPVVTAAEREATGSLAGGLGLDQATLYTIGAPSWRDYSLAREVDAARDLAPIHELAAHRRADVLGAVATLSSDPEPMYELLWNNGRPSPSDLRLLGESLREAPNLHSAWCLRLLEALDESGSLPELAALRWHLGPALPRLLAAAAHPSPERAIALLQGGALQPGAMVLMRLLDEPAAPPALCWAAADLLSARMIDPALLFEPATALTPLSHAVRGYILATGSPQSRAAMDRPEAAPWVAALGSPALDPTRQAAAARSLLSDPLVSDKARAAALAMIATLEPAARHEQLGGACADAMPLVRTAALVALDSLPDGERLLVLSRVLATPALDGAALHDALDRLLVLRQGEASALLARCVLSASLPLDGRLRALAALAERGAGPLLLTRLIRVAGLHPAVRSAVASLLGRLRVGEALPELRELVLDSRTTPVLRQAAATSLGALGSVPEARAAAVAPLLRLLVEPTADHLLLVAVIRALGVLGAAGAIPVLESLVHEGAADRIRAAWQALAPQANNEPPMYWAATSLPDAERLAAQSLMAEGETPADRPGSLNELVERQAEAVRAAAAEALSSLALADVNLRNEVARILHLALRGRASASLVRRLLAALVRMRPDSGLSDLGRLLADATLDTAVRWLAIEQIGERPQAAAILVRYLQPGSVDSFIAAKLAEQLGRIAAPEAFGILAQLAEGASDLQLREAAIAALGNLHDPAVEPTLLRIIGNPVLTLSLRVVAANALGAGLSPATRQAGRDLLRNERPPAALAAALLRALGRVADREAMPMLLLYAQSEQPDEALAAIEALALLGDESISPLLVRITQNPGLAPEVRLAAAGTLLQLGGPEYMPLLQHAVGGGALSLQLQAFDLIQAAQPNVAQLGVLLVDRSAPLVLRLRAVPAATQHAAALPQLLATFADPEAPLQLRVLLAGALGRSGAASAIEALAAVAAGADCVPLLRLRAIEALAMIANAPNGQRARAALGRVASETSPPVERWSWATHALIAA